MSQDDLSSRENQRPPGRRSRAPWIIGLNIAAGLTAAAVFTGISLGTQHGVTAGASAPVVVISGTTAATGGPHGSAPATTGALPGIQVSFTGASLDQCSAEGTIHSTSGGRQVVFVFGNNTSGTLHLSWLNHQGHSVPYETLLPGQASTMNTATGDVWKIANTSSGCLVILTISGLGLISAS